MVNAASLAPATFTFGVGPYRAGQLTVVSFGGVEEISRLFRFDVVLSARGVEVNSLTTAILGQPASLGLTLEDGTQRTIAGVVAAYSIEGKYTDDAVRIRVRLVPRVWKLTRRKNSRIFQEKAINEIIDVILDESQIDRTWTLVRKYPPREYCVQYQETDFAFIARLLGEEGIFFYFDHPNGIADAALGLVGGAMGKAASSLGGIGGAVAGAAVGEALDQFAPSEKIVFADKADAYPSMKLSDLELTVSDVADKVGLGSVSSKLADAGIDVDPGPGIPFRDAEQMTTDGAYVFAFVGRRTLRPKSTFLHDFDFTRPLLTRTATAQTSASTSIQMPGLDPGVDVDLRATAGPRGLSSLAGLSGGVEADFPPRLEPKRFEIYDHEADDHREHEIGKEDAELQLAQHRRKADVSYGSSTCRMMEPGRRFNLEAHAIERLNREYAVVRVEHIGRTPEGHGTGVGDVDARDMLTYENRFRAVPAKVPFRPAARARGRVQVLESATVTGPTDSEIHADEYGRIKVRFHWDREGKADDTSSCWVRVAHTWAGTGWGTQFIPRVGMEVLVSFLGGSTDQPIVMGCVYNGTHRPPYNLPASKTRSGSKTSTTPGGGGHNEIYFEDQKGNEAIHIKAERDMQHVVQNDLAVSVDHDQAISVGNDQSTVVGGGVNTSVGRDHVLNVRGSSDEVIGGHLSTSVSGDVSRAVSGGRLDEIRGDKRMSVGGSEATMVEGRFVRVVKDAYELQVTKQQQVIVGEKGKETFSSMYVWGDILRRASKTMFFNAPESITLQCGDSTIVLEPKQITVTSDTLVFRGTKTTTVIGKDASAVLDGDITQAGGQIKLYAKDTSIEMKSGATEIDGNQKVSLISGAGGTLVLDANAALDGTQVKLNCGPGSAGNSGPKSDAPPSSQPPSSSQQPIKITLKDAAMQPYKSRPYELTVGEIVIEGTTDDTGLVDQKVDKLAKSALLTLWVTDPPTGVKLQWTLDLTVQALEPATDLKGALTRLSHLGYYQGPLDAEKPNELVRAAVRWFQTDNDLKVTGDLDGDTTSKLSDVHGS